jgi:hypothetical protein
MCRSTVIGADRDGHRRHRGRIRARDARGRRVRRAGTCRALVLFDGDDLDAATAEPDRRQADADDH